MKASGSYLATLGLVVFVGCVVAMDQLPAIGAGGLLHPMRRPVAGRPPDGCRSTTLAGADVRLQGWRCDAVGPRRGSLIYLHGVGDNRTTGRGAIERFGARGFDVVVYDSRAHGESEGDACTYGYFEKVDLRRVMDTLAPGPVVLLGTSLGAAVALQAAADEPRVSVVVAAETFSDLRTVATERAPFFFTRSIIARAFTAVEEAGRFRIDAVSPVASAARITAPVLLLHGDQDTETPPDHSRRVWAALHGAKKLMMVPGAGHNGSLRGDILDDVARWIDGALGPPR